MKVISEIYKIRISLSSRTRMYELAYERAGWRAFLHFDIDEDGHSDKVKEWSRSDSVIQMKLVESSATLGTNESNFDFTFEAWCEKMEDDD